MPGAHVQTCRVRTCRRARCVLTCYVLRAQGRWSLAATFSSRAFPLSFSLQFLFVVPPELQGGRFRVFGQGEVLLESCSVDVFAQGRVLQVVGDFTQRGERVAEELNDLCRFEPGESLADVSAHASGGWRS